MREILKRYVNSYENLTPHSIPNLINCLHKNFVFVDPFNTIKGKENFELFLEKMFSRVKNPKFKIKFTLKKKNQVLIKWNFKCLALKNKIDFDGVSEVILKDNKVFKHIDYWDSGRNIYGKIPLLGFIFRKIHK